MLYEIIIPATGTVETHERSMEHLKNNVFADNSVAIEGDRLYSHHLRGMVPKCKYSVCMSSNIIL